MKCEQARKLLLESPRLGRRLKDHLRSCGVCAAEARNLEGVQSLVAGWRDVEPPSDLLDRMIASQSGSFAKPRIKEIRRMVTYGLSTALAIGGVALFTSLSSTANADVNKVEQAINKAKSAKITFYGTVDGGAPKLKGTVWYDSGKYRVEVPGKAPVVMKGYKIWTFDAKSKTWKEQKEKNPASLYSFTRQFVSTYSVPLPTFTGQVEGGPELIGTVVDLPFDSKGKVAKLGKSEFVATGALKPGVQEEDVWEMIGPAEVTFVASKNTLLPKAMATYKVDAKGRKIPTGYATFTFNKQIPQDKFSTYRWLRLDK